MIDLSGKMIWHLFGAFFRFLAQSIITRVLRDVLGSTLLATPDVTAEGRVRDLWAVSAGIADSVLVLGVLTGGIVVMTHESIQIRYGIKDILGRMVWATVATNMSLMLCGVAIRSANSVSYALLGQGVDGNQLMSGWLNNIAVKSGGALLALLAVVAGVMLVAVVLTFIIRSTLMVILVVGAPLALVCHMLPYTERVASAWWRSVASLLITQMGQSLMLIACVRIFFTADGRSIIGMQADAQAVNMLMVICLAYLLIRMPTYAKRLTAGGIGAGGNTIVRLVQYYVVQQGLRKIGGRIAGQAGERGRRGK